MTQLAFAFPPTSPFIDDTGVGLVGPVWSTHLRITDAGRKAVEG